MNEHMRKIIDSLNFYTEAYNKGEPIISDQDWDKLYLELQELEKETGCIYPDSPTQTIHYDFIDKLDKITHQHPMLSLAKTKSPEEVMNYFNDHSFVAMTKLDGLSMSLTYHKGKLVSAATRGNGEIGEDITHNAHIIHNIPQTIKCDVDLVVNGEIICPKDVFDEYFSKDYKNPRNFAAGSIRLLNSKDCESRKLKFIAWDCVEGTEFKNFSERLNFLYDIGFNVVLYSNIFNVKDSITYIKDISKINNYPLDGVVFRFEDIEFGESLGMTAHHPNHSIAFKFVDETVESKLIDIEYEPSRNGILTPIAVFEPVELEGSIINRASIHNITIMNEIFHGTPWKGQGIEIFKANMIIPQIKSTEDVSDGLFYPELPFIDLPEKCPVCGEKLTILKSDSGVSTLTCTNEKCSSRLINQLDHFCGKNGFDIKGLSKATLNKLISWGYINNKVDIFNLYIWTSKWIQQPGFGEKSVLKIIDAINYAEKNITLERFICSLGIPLVGLNVAKMIVKRIKSYEEFREMIRNNYDFSTWEGFGPEISKSLLNYNYEEADEIASYLSFENNNTSEEETTKKLDSLKVVITGKLNRSRTELTKLIEDNGGKVVGSVSSKTNYLIANKEENSIKYKTAMENGIKIITEEDFIKLFDL